jgi:hypothetical protein
MRSSIILAATLAFGATIMPASANDAPKATKAVITTSATTAQASGIAPRRTVRRLVATPTRVRMAAYPGYCQTLGCRGYVVVGIGW